jgi:hypothetical protein
MRRRQDVATAPMLELGAGTLSGSTRPSVVGGL